MYSDLIYYYYGNHNSKYKNCTGCGNEITELHFITRNDSGYCNQCVPCTACIKCNTNISSLGKNDITYNRWPQSSIKDIFIERLAIDGTKIF